MIKNEIGLTPNQKINNNNIQLIKSSISIKFLPSNESKKILLIYKEFINNRLNYKYIKKIRNDSN